ADAGELVTPLFPGVRTVLETLHNANVEMAIATGKSMRGLQRTLREHNLNTFFHSLQTADVARSKPDPEMIENILRETGSNPKETLMVGDTTFDIEMGHQAGVITCAVTYGCHSRERLAQARPHHWLERMADLPALLGLKIPP
ncbi:MAG: HAD-IA family hydrolase, partial [Magnetococcus sp. XQGC-1]